MTDYHLHIHKVTQKAEINIEAKDKAEMERKLRQMIDDKKLKFKKVEGYKHVVSFVDDEIDTYQGVKE